MSLGLHRPSFPEREPGRGHFIPQPHAAVGLHKWAETGGGTFRQLGSQLMVAVGRPRTPKPNPVRGHQAALHRSWRTGHTCSFQFGRF